MWRRSVAAGALGCVVLVLTGCGATRPAIPGTSGQPTATHTATSPTPGGNREAATVAAARLLAAFHLPGAATAESRRPKATPTSLDQPPVLPSTPDLVDQTRWFEVPEALTTALAQVNARTPAGMTRQGSGSSYGLICPVTFTTFAAPPVTGVFTQRSLLVAACAVTRDTTELRVDAQVIWLPDKPATDRIPASATSVTAVAHSASRPGGPRATPAYPATYPPVTTSNPTAVARIIQLLNGLPRYLPGLRSCPAATGAHVTLTFRHGSGGPEVASADVGMPGCGAVTITTGGTRQPALTPSGDLVPDIARALGTSWPGLGS